MPPTQEFRFVRPPGTKMPQLSVTITLPIGAVSGGITDPFTLWRYLAGIGEGCTVEVKVDQNSSDTQAEDRP